MEDRMVAMDGDIGECIHMRNGGNNSNNRSNKAMHRHIRNGEVPDIAAAEDGKNGIDGTIASNNNNKMDNGNNSNRRSHRIHGNNGAMVDNPTMYRLFHPI